jgi:hypothetical protein
MTTAKGGPLEILIKTISGSQLRSKSAQRGERPAFLSEGGGRSFQCFRAARIGLTPGTRPRFAGLREARAMSHSQRTVIVDDEASGRHVFRTALRSDDVHRFSAADSEAARAALERDVEEPAAVRAGTGTPFPDSLTSAKRALRHRLLARARVLPREAIKEQPDSAEPRYLMGVVEEMRNKRRATCREYQTALRVDSNFEPAKQGLVTCEDQAWSY